MTKIITGMIAIVGMVFLAGLVALFFISDGDILNFVQITRLQWQLSARADELNMPVGTDPSPIRFDIASGESPPQIAGRLASAGLISDNNLFIIYLRVEGLDTQLEAGAYFLRRTQTIPQIAIALTDARNSSITFRVVEGSRIEEIASQIDAQRSFKFSGADFLAVVGAGATIPAGFAEMMAIPSNSSLEGFLFPGTYILPPEITAIELRDTLLQAFAEAISPALLADAARQGLSMFQVVTLASIVEREAVWDDEMSLIASVYRNRQDIGMKLDADPTVQYGLNGTRGEWWPRISISDYTGVTSPYNTYLRTGLPPGPISNTTLNALEAVIYPDQTAFYYFRAKCDGSFYHNFARDYDEHLRNAC